jgi:hypothetical protein
MPEDIIDLILETAGEHLVSLVQHKLLDLVSPDTYKMMNVVMKWQRTFTYFILRLRIRIRIILGDGSGFASK